MNRSRKADHVAVSAKSPRAQLNGFIAKYSPDIAAEARAALIRMRRLIPGAVELVYDNYNALAVAFGPSERASEAVVSIAVYPRWVSLFFLQDGPRLPDPEGLLNGAGTKVRHIVLESAKDLDKPAVRLLIREALTRAVAPIDSAGRGRIVVRSISAKQRPRRAKGI
jgi:hypothetical protein